MTREDDADLFDTTRGRLLLILCRGPRTVNELSEALKLTDNAVRAQLASLQDAGFVRPIGLRPGTRRPHVDYELTPRARELFPQAHDPALRALLDVMRERLEPGVVRALLKQAAQRLVEQWVGRLSGAEPRKRVAELWRRLNALTAGIAVEQTPGRETVRACGCPLASVTATHPEVCRVLAEVLSELLGTSVREKCDRTDGPRCCFEVEEGPE